MRKASSGTESAMFSIEQNGDSTKIYCNKPRLFPELSRLEGQEAVAKVAIVSENGRQYHVLNGLREANMSIQLTLSAGYRLG